MSPAMIIGLGRLLFDVTQWVYEHVTDVEDNREYDSEHKKHAAVSQSVKEKINQALRGEQAGCKDRYKLTNTEAGALKALASKQVDKRIKEQVKRLHDSGYFIKEK